MFEGLAYRLEQEITKLAPAGAKIRVIAPSNRFLAVWMGASTFASLSTFSDSCVTADITKNTVLPSSTANAADFSQKGRSV